MTALWFERALLPGGWAEGVRLNLRQGVIGAIECDVEARSGEERGAIGLPGMGNVHSHAFQRAMAGLTETRSAGGGDFWSWRETMYRFVGLLSPDDVEAIAAQAFAEMLVSGFTRVGEFHYIHNELDGTSYENSAEMAERIVAAASISGIGLTLLPVFYAHGGFGGAPTSPRQARFSLSVDRFAEVVAASGRAIKALADGRLGIAPHSLRAVTASELAAIMPLVGEGPVHIHVAEQAAEVEACLAWSGERPVAWLLNNAPVDAGWCLVHATHLNEAEIAAVAGSGATVGLCPITEANLGDGLFPAKPYLGAGGAIGVGSDSNVRIDLTEELRLFEYGQRLARRSRGVAGSGAELFKRALGGGARALGEASPGIAVGAAADLIDLDGRHPALAARRGDALLDAWIFAGGREAIASVWRRGAKLVENGRHINGEAIAARYGDTLVRILGA